MSEILTLFVSFFRIGLFAVGGAYSFLPLLEKEIVDKYHWLTKAEFLDVLGLVKIFPGAISIKYATYTGHKVAGIPGVFAANIGVFLPPVIFVMFAASLYHRYKDVALVHRSFDMIQLAAFALILAVAFKMIDFNQLATSKGVFFVIIFFALSFIWNVHPAYIIAGAGCIGAFLR